ncbi:MAG: hypothetical protein JST75_09515 [Bacteroidetes bacterium]|nr:hypothetical protein [Bacteroidota bacterium]
MFFRKIKQRQKKERDEDHFLQKCAEKINARIKTVAGMMTKKTENISASKKKIGLVFFCLLFGSASIYIMIKTVVNVNIKSKRVIIQPIRIPKNIGRSKDWYVTMSDSEIKNIQKLAHEYQKLMDSADFKTTTK